MPQSLIGLKQIRSGELGSYITGALGFGVTGSNSVSIYKDLFVTGKATFSGTPTFDADAFFNQEAFFNSGINVSGDITGRNNLIVNNNLTVSGLSSFKNNAFFEQNVVVTGTFRTEGAATFNDPTTFNDTSTFNNAVSLNAATVNGVATFNANTNLIGLVNTLGAGGGSPSTNYYPGNNIFSGAVNLTGNVASRGTNTFYNNNTFNSGVNFNSGKVTFSGASQDFLTPLNISGYTKIFSTGEVENLLITNSLNIDNTSLATFSGSGLILNSFISSGVNPFYFLDGAYQNLYSASHIDFQSGAYSVFNDNSYLTIRTGAQLFLSGTQYNSFNSKTYYESGSQLFFQSGSIATGTLNLLSGSRIGIGTSKPNYAIEVIGYNTNVSGTGYFKDLRRDGYEVVSEYTFNAKSYSLAAGDTYKTITYNAVSGTPIINPNIRATGTAAQIGSSDLLAAMISGEPTTTTATILFSAEIPTNNRYLLDVIIASPTF